jgi:hypothetical protein
MVPSVNKSLHNVGMAWKDGRMDSRNEEAGRIKRKTRNKGWKRRDKEEGWEV